MQNNYKELIKQLNALVIIDEVRSNNPLGKNAARAIEELLKENEELKEKLESAENFIYEMQMGEDL